MIRLRLCAWLVVLVVRTANAQQGPPFELTADPSAPVITLNDVGGLTVLPRQNVKPELTIRTDGRVTIADPFGTTKDLEAQISLQELQDLLRFSINEQEFGQFSTADTQQAIAAENARCGKSIRVADAATTVLHIQTADMDHEGRFNALGVFAEAYPGVKSLGQLWAIQLRLRHLMEEIKAGGKESVAAAVDDINAAVKQQTDAIELHSEDFQRTILNPDGRRMLEFVRDRGDGTSISVSVEYKTGQTPSVNARAYLNPPARPTMSCP